MRGLIFTLAFLTSQSGAFADACLFNSDCLPNQVCAANRCRVACRDDSDCSGATWCYVTGDPLAAGLNRTCVDWHDYARPTPLDEANAPLFTVRDRYDYPGNDRAVYPIPIQNPNLCAIQCARRTGCSGFVMVRRGFNGSPVPLCYLKEGALGSGNSNPCCVSGRKN